MKFNVEVNADDTVEELKTMANEFLADIMTKYLPLLFLFLAILVITLVLTSCCGFYLAIWLHRSCHCRRFRCCFWVECGREHKQQQQKQKQNERQWRYNKEGNETCV